MIKMYKRWLKKRMIKKIMKQLNIYELWVQIVSDLQFVPSKVAKKENHVAWKRREITLSQSWNMESKLVFKKLTKLWKVMNTGKSWYLYQAKDWGGKVSIVEHPEHYGGDTVYEAIKVIEAWQLNFNLGNAVKYISRAGKKDKSKEIQDLQKAVWYIERQIENSEKKEWKTQALIISNLKILSMK